MKNLFIIMGVLFALIPSISHAEKIVAVGDTWPPFVSEDLPDKGIAMAIAKAAFESQGYEVEMKFVPWARAIGGVKSGTYDVLVSTWWTKERSEYLNYSDYFIQNNIKFIKKAADDFEYEGLESLEGKTVGVIRAYGYSEDFLAAENFTKPEVAAFVYNLKKLNANRIDLTLEDEIVAKSVIAKDDNFKGKFTFSKKNLSSNNLYVTSGLKNPRNKSIINAFNKGLEIIKNNGLYEEILKRHKI